MQEAVERTRPLTPEDQKEVISDYHTIGYKHTLKKWHLSRIALDTLVLSVRTKLKDPKDTVHHAVQRLKADGHTSREISQMLKKPLSVINDLWAPPMMFS